MLLLNFAHPLTDEQLAQTAALLGAQPIMRTTATTIDRGRPIAEVAIELAEAVGLTPDEWQTRPFLLNPPALAPWRWR